MKHFIIRTKSNEYIAVDDSSGGYPCLEKDWSRAQIWTDEAAARRYMEMFNEKSWTLNTIDVEFKLALNSSKLGTSDECVHTRHCCVIHGCKYDDSNCPVERKIKHQDYECEQCQWEKG